MGWNEVWVIQPSLLPSSMAIVILVHRRLQSWNVWRSFCTTKGNQSSQSDYFANLFVLCCVMTTFKSFILLPDAAMKDRGQDFILMKLQMPWSYLNITEEVPQSYWEKKRKSHDFSKWKGKMEMCRMRKTIVKSVFFLNSLHLVHNTFIKQTFLAS